MADAQVSLTTRGDASQAALVRAATLRTSRIPAPAPSPASAPADALETAPRLLGGNWDFSRVPLHRSSAPAPAPAPARWLPGPIQRKLKVGAINDPLEHEADRVAGQVMATPASDAVTISSPPQVSRKCDSCEEEEKLQKKEKGPQTSAGEAPASVHETLRSAGRPLDAQSRAFFEPRFGRDLSQVRVHTDPRAAESAHSVTARAYTVGHHVVFGRGEYAPHTADGRQLLAHELTHTLQQHGGVPSLRREPPKSPPPAQPSLEARLKVIEEGGPAIQARLDQIIHTGGPLPDTKDGAKVIGAAIIDVEGYTGPKEMRAINGVAGDAVGQGAPVYHATSPTNRTLSATQGARTEKGGREASILGPRKESIFSHANDAEMKLFEDIIARLPKGAKGTIYFTTVRIRQVGGKTVIEPYPACSGCIRASFETAGITGIDLVSHAPAHPVMSTAEMGEPHGGAGEPPAQAAKPATTGEPVTGEPAPGGPGTGGPAAGGPGTGGPAAGGPGTGGPGAGKAAPVKGAGAKPGTVAEGEPPGASGGASPATAATKSTGPARGTPGAAPRIGRSAQFGIEFGAGIATAGLGWLAAYLKGKVDQKIAQQQIDAFLQVAKKRINANPDEAVKKMMVTPDATIYAWVHLDSSVITTFGVGTAPEPVPSDSSPIIDLSRIEYMPAPMDPSLIEAFPRVGGGGLHATVTRDIVIDIPLKTPPLEDIIGYAKSRGLPLDDLLAYVNTRYQAALSTLVTTLDARQRILAAFQASSEAFKQLQADFKIAQARHDTELQKFIASKLLEVSAGSKTITDQLKPVGESIQSADKNVQHWKHILDLIKGARP